MTQADGHPALHPGRSAWVELSDVRIGWIGELHPRWQQKYDLPHAPILFEVDAQALMMQRLPQLVDVSKFPPVYRDIALIVPQTVNAQALLEEFQQARSEAACKAVTHVALFDEYKPKEAAKEAGMGGFLPDEKSLAFRITLQDSEGTLQDETVDQAVQTMIQRLMRRCGARLRG
jgi:phenylalanyl-tRNA synthetase beta chain